MKHNKYGDILLWLAGFLSAYLTNFCIFYVRGTHVYDVTDVLSNMHGVRIESLCVIAAGTYLYRNVYRIRDRRIGICAAAGAVVFTLCHFFGYNIYEFDRLWLPCYSSASFFMELACLAGTFLMFNGLLRGVLYAFVQHPVPRCRRNSRWSGCGWRSFFICFSLVLGAHLLFLSVFYSGVVTKDVNYQIAEGLGALPLSDRHPYIHTLILGGLIRLGRALFGTVLDGVALCVTVQAVLISAAVAFILQYMAKREIHLGFRVAALLYFILHPVVICDNVTLWKDIWQAYFILIYVVMLTELALNRDQFFASRENWILTVGAVLGTLFFKNTGIFIVGVSLPFFLISSRKNRKKAALLMTACIALFCFSRYVMIPQLGIVQNDKKEPLSVPLQQIARTFARNGEDIPEEEKEILNEILPCDRLQEVYEPRISDPVKSLLNEQAFSDAPMRYAASWFRLGSRFPVTYLESFLANSVGYWNTGVLHGKIPIASYLEGELVDGSGQYGGYVDPDADTYDPESVHPELRERYKERYNRFRRLPGIAVLSSLGAYFWSAFLMALVCIVKKRYRLLLPLSAVLGVFLVCIMSPLVAECRYAFLALIVQPVLWPFVLQEEETRGDASLQEPRN